MTLNLDRLDARVKRARSMVNRGAKYKLGAGGFNPTAKVPWNANQECDCTGFISWVLGMSRYQGDKKKPWSRWLPWIESTALYKDASDGRPPFVPIPGPLPGCIAVYPDGWLKSRQGHAAIVTQVFNGSGKFMIVDCSTRQGDAIAERDGSWMYARRVRFCVLAEDLQ